MDKPAVKVTNKKFAEDNTKFVSACQRAGIPATARQASKFRAEKGLAYNS